MKISFYQQSINETEKQHTENKAVRVKNGAEISKVSGNNCFIVGLGAEEIPGKTVEKGKSLIELQFIQRMTRTSNNAIIYFGVEIYDPEDEDII